MDNPDPRIDRFLSGNMTKAEKEAFEKQLATEPALRQALDTWSPAYRAVELQSRLDLKKKLARLDLDMDQPATRPLWKRTGWMLGLAASVAIVTMLGIWWNSQESGIASDQLLAQYLEPYESPVQLRSGDSESMVREASAAYSRQDYAESARLFEELRQAPDFPATDMAQFYAGLSYLLARDPDPHTSIGLLAPLATRETLYREPAIWYQALANLMLNRDPEAAALLEQLENYRVEEANNLLEQLNK